MDAGQLTIDNVTQLLLQRPFPASVEAALLTIRECPMFARQDLSMLANRFIFCHSLSPSSTNPSQPIWIKTLNNIQELHMLDLIRQFLENQSDLATATRVFDMIFLDVLSDADHPLFTLHYNLFLKFLSLVISFESKSALTIIARWFLALPNPKEAFIGKIIEHIIREHIALATTNSVNNLCTISPLFTLCFINQTCLLLDNEHFRLDANVVQTLIELLTFGLTNSTDLLLLTLQQEFLAENPSSSFNFIPSMVRLDVLFSRRSLESSPPALRLHLDHFHTAILSFLFAMITSHSSQSQPFQKSLFPPHYFEQLCITLQDSLSHDKSTDECIQRYLQILAVCKTFSCSMSPFSISDLGKSYPFLTRDKLFDILQEKEAPTLVAK